MSRIIQIVSIIVFIQLTTSACSDSLPDAATSSSTEESTSSTSSSTDPISLSLSSSTVDLDGYVTIYVSGGTGSYSSASASEGTIYQSTTDTYYYVAPSSVTSSTITISVTDSDGNVGYGYITINSSSSSSSSSTTSGTISCSGTYDAVVGKNAATLVLVDDEDGNAAGYLLMSGVYYPLSGTCSIANGAGTLSMTELNLKMKLNATITADTSAIQMTGKLKAGNLSYSLTASSQDTPVEVVSPTDSCAGTYSAKFAGTSGKLILVQNGYNQVAGYIKLLGYNYPVAGECDLSSGTIELTNMSTDATYTGSISTDGSTYTISGTFTQLNKSRSWSASK